MKIKYVAIVFSLSVPCYGADVTLISGVYKQEKTKINGSNAGGQSEISAGARYHEDLSTQVAWFGQAQLAFRDYRGADDRKAPDNSTGIAIGGGLRRYFANFPQGVAPFVAGVVAVKNDKTAVFTQGGYVETSENGLFYGATLGLRLGLDTPFFAELELPIFESALIASVKEETYSETTKETTKKEGTRTELFASSRAPLTHIMVGVGMRL
jgi:hypothetical protein